MGIEGLSIDITYDPCEFLLDTFNSQKIDFSGLRQKSGFSISKARPLQILDSGAPIYYTFPL
jgi:hypothetical protein